jgi:hypothetical protein
MYASFLVAMLWTTLIGRAKPDPVSVLFTDPSGIPCTRPCLLGIQPGQTTFTDAIAMVKTHPLTRHLRMFTSSDNDPSITAAGSFYDTWAFRTAFTVLFAGQSGQIVQVEIQKDPAAISNPMAKVITVTISSRIAPSAPALPAVDPVLVQLWHQTTLEQVVASIGPPELLSFPNLGIHYRWGAEYFIEAFYNHNRLVFTFAAADGTPYFGNNAFGSVSVYSDSMAARVGDVGTTLPWLGLAHPQKYRSWLDSHTPLGMTPAIP